MLDVIYGLNVCMLQIIYYAGCIIPVPRFEVEFVLELINKYRPTLFPGAPTIYVAINNHPKISNYDLKSIRNCLSGAAPLPLEVKSEFEKKTSGKLIEGYGLTEASPVTHCNPIDGIQKEGSIGIPLPDTEAKIVDLETGEQEVGIGETGELIISGPQVMKGYLKREEETKRTKRGGWPFNSL